MTKDSKTGWYTFTIKAKDAKVIINDGTAAGEKEPAGANAPGLGEIYAGSSDGDP